MLYAFLRKHVFCAFLVTILMTLGCVPVERSVLKSQNKGYLSKERKKAKEPVIRILLLHNYNHVDIYGKIIRVIGQNGEKVFYYRDRIEVVSGPKTQINGVELEPPIVMVGDEKSRIKINDNYYIGKQLYIYKNDLVLHIPIEEYLCGVVNSEMSPKWPLEALKAQAVVARTFAVYKMLINRDKDYDMGSTLLFQKYTFGNYDKKILDAVKETRGIIIYYRDAPIESFYHSCSGGITESAGNVFQQDLPYLRSIVDPYSRDCKDSKWKVCLPAGDIVDLIKKNRILKNSGVNFKTDSLTSIRIGSRTSSGRVKNFILRLNNKDYSVDGNRFRLAVGSKKLKSLLIDSIHRETEGDKTIFIISGRGYGHGVGMSQWGAKKMAELGFSYMKIINFYYRGVHLGDYYKLPLNFE